MCMKNEFKYMHTSYKEISSSFASKSSFTGFLPSFYSQNKNLFLGIRD